ncbi:uncharacterized protein LOC106643780 [Copidosoma floridanum]|uniref:uncharacterized protein LOC106643780 n=1 Tax=Copidosoma floridanum TaxID=29053 RepID=UPI0006C950F7|nr:uncharacterized protein LOC106643780 [Copidosoma floridanum]
MTLSYLHSTVWITRGLSIATGVYRRCTTCTKFNARSPVQLMGSLPAVRTTPTRPFATTGLDYAGPIPVLFSKGRCAKSTKGYIAIFICMVTRAVHIEIVSSLTTYAFLAAFARFSARRGVPSSIYSDNATTFKGAAKELQAMFAQSTSFVDTVASALFFQRVNWAFIPPRAPHFGGLWEAAVRSFKHHFLRVVSDAILMFEELATLASKIEACWNSRPLCPLSSNATDATALTPAHFLVGSLLLAFPEPHDDAKKPKRLNDR